MSLREELERAGIGELARQLESINESSLVRWTQMQDSVTKSTLDQMEEWHRLNREREERERALMHAEAIYPVYRGLSQLPDPGIYGTMPQLRPVDPEKRQADEFMRGLRKQAEQLAGSVQDNQELRMYCFDGFQQMQVLEISMPSDNVVALCCIDSDGNETHVTGHMHSVRFSFVIHTLVPPQVPRPIGFNMP